MFFLRLNKKEVLDLTGLPFMKLPFETTVHDPTELVRTLHDVEGHVHIRICDKTTNDEPSNGVGKQQGHEIPFYRGFIIQHVFSADLTKRKTVYLMVSLLLKLCY
jgi:hypothetical protein